MTIPQMWNGRRAPNWKRALPPNVLLSPSSWRAPKRSASELRQKARPVSSVLTDQPSNSPLSPSSWQTLTRLASKLRQKGRPDSSLLVDRMAAACCSRPCRKDSVTNPFQHVPHTPSDTLYLLLTVLPVRPPPALCNRQLYIARVR